MTDSQESTSSEDYDEYINGNGFVMARKGRHIIMRSHRTKEEHKAFLQTLLDGSKETEESIKAQINEIEELIHPYNPLDILANVSLRNSVINADEFKEYESTINPAYTEYISLLCLTQPFDSFNFKNSEPIPNDLIEDLQERIRTLFNSVAFFLAFKNVDPDRDSPPDVSELLRFLTLSESLVVRYPAYHHHLIQDLQEIFAPISSEMERTLGFNISNSIEILDSIGILTSARIIEMRDEAFQNARALRKAVKNFRHKKKIKKVLSEFPRDVLDRLAKEKPSVSAKLISNASISWTFHQLGAAFSFTVDEVTGQTGLNPETVSSFLNHFSLQFGEVDTFFRTPAPTHPLMRRPLIKHEDRFFCPVLDGAYWALRAAIEDFWNPQSPSRVIHDDPLWQKYLKTRATYLEKSAIQSLSLALKYASAYQNLKYEFMDCTGKRVETELDGLLILDNALFLVEAKSGSLSLPARRGAPGRMKEDIIKLVEEAYSQALRASNYIANNERPVFRLHDGTEIIIDKSKHNEIYLVTVSLDDLDTFITNTYLLKEYGFLQGDRYPWTVTLANLRVICEMTEFSSQLVHYIKRRLHVNELGWVYAHDELDWFGYYLKEGLYFDNLKENPEEKFKYNLLSYSWIFDDYYYYIYGDRKTPVEKPHQEMPLIMHQVLQEIDGKHDTGYLDVACCLMDMASESREKLFNAFLELRNKTIKDREIHSITIPFLDGDFGFAFFVCPCELEEEFQDRIMKYSILKKYQTKFTRWITIGCIADTRGWVDYFIVIDGQWVFDQQLDEASKVLLMPWPGNEDTNKKE